MTTVSVVTAQPGAATRIERVYLDGDHADGFTHEHNGPCWRVSISKRGAQLRDTRDSERRDDFHSADKGGPGRPAGAKVGHRKLTRVPKAEVAGLSNEKIAETSGTRLPSSEPN